MSVAWKSDDHAHRRKTIRLLPRRTGRFVAAPSIVALIAVLSLVIPGWHADTVAGDVADSSTIAKPALEEPARYTFASVQESATLRATPGREIDATVYFYNIDGNRTTHISLEVLEAPADWEVRIDPPLRQVQVGPAEDTATISENLQVEPGGLYSEELEDAPAGMVCLYVPNRGYTLASAATITICVPQTAETGTQGEVVISAEAFWLGQTGAATVAQARQFAFRVNT
jgi:hypothetical protein